MTHANEHNGNGTALVVRDDAPIAFGSRGEIEALARRIQVMLPSAQLADWQLKKTGAELAAIQKNLNDSLYRAAQLCAFYRLVPGEDVHLIPFGNTWAVDMGIETWKKAADRYCSLHGITYHLHVVEMPAEELKARQGENYTPEDVGAIAYLWRSDKAQVYEIFGAEQAMTKGYGVWAKKARYDKFKKEWQPDNIPVQRSAMDVAERRAMKMALKREFSLDSLLAATPNEIRNNVGALEMRAKVEERQRALPASPPRGSMDDDIDELWDQATAGNRQEEPDPEEPIEGEYRQAEPEAYDNPFDDAPDPTPAHDRLAAEGASTFGPDWPGCAAWLVKRYTETNTPAAVRGEPAQLSADEADDLADKMIANRRKYQAGWKAHQAKVTA